MSARFKRAWARASRANLVASAGFLRALSASPFVSANGTQGQGGTPDTYRLCAAKIPKVRAIANWLLRRKASLSAARRAVFEQ